MIRMVDFEPFVYYKTNTIVRMPESKIAKKGMMYAVLAPSVKDELKFLSNQTTMEFRHLYKYFVEYMTVYQFHGGGKVKIFPNKDGELSKLIQTPKFKSRFKNIEGVTSYKPSVKTSPLKGFNTLFEINFMTNTVLSNPKDHRMMIDKLDDAWGVIRSRLQDTCGNYRFNETYERYLIIPLELWVNADELKQTRMFSKTTSNLIGHLIYRLQTDQKSTMEIFNGWNVVLNYGNRFLKITGKRPDKAGDSFIAGEIKKFMARCVSVSRTDMSDEVTPEQDELTQEEKDKLLEAKVKSAKAIEVDRIIERSNIDPEKLEDDKRKKLEDMVEVQISEEPDENGETDVTVVHMRDVKEDKDVDIVIQAKMEGKSIESYKRDQMLKDKYRSFSYKGRPMEEVLQDDAVYEIPVVKPKMHTVNPAYQEIRSHNFERAYNETVSDYDFTNIILHFNSCKPALYLISDPIVEDISDRMNRLYRVTLEYEDESRKRHKFSFKMPKWYKDKYLFINEQEWNLTHQKMPFPVSKTGPNMCQVSTNYNKIRMHRYGQNLSSKVTKLKKVLSGAECPSNILVHRGNNTVPNKNYLTSLEYDELGANFDSIRCIKMVIHFSVDDAIIVVGPTPNFIEDKSVYPIGLDRGKDEKYYLSGETNKVYKVKGKSQTAEESGELSDFIINEIEDRIPKFKDRFDDTSAGTKFAYTRARIMDEHLPLVVVLSAADPGGLAGVLDIAKINYEFVEQRPHIDKENQGIVPFSDGYLVYDRYPYENSLLMNGWSVVPTKEYSYYDMATRDTYVEIFDTLVNRRNLIDGIENFYYLLIDPITDSVLTRIGMPNTFTELMLYANGKLADNSYQPDEVYYDSRVRSNEILNAYLYQELASAYASWKIGRSPKFSIPEDAIIKKCLESNIIDSHSKLNMILEAENDRQIKLKGPGGMNEDRSFTLEKRAYHESMKGIVGMNSTPSGEVGINRHLTLNCNIVDSRGFIEVGKKEYDGTELTTPGELMNVFGPESADIERVAMAISQSKHVIPVAKSSPSLISYDMERVLPFLSNDFAAKARKPGKVVEITDEVMIVQYNDGTYDDIDLGERADKNTDGGFYIMNQFVTDFKVGDKFDAEEILAYEPKFISDKDELGDYTANVGTLARVAIVANGTVFEDAGYITDKLAHDMATKITKHKSVIVSQFANVKFIVKKGQEIKANDPLIVFDDTRDQFTSDLLANMAKDAADEDEIVASTAPVVSKVTGVVKDIKIYYTVPLESMTPSLRKIIEDYNAKVKKKAKLISKYVNLQDSNTILPPDEQVIPDATGRVKGVKVGDGILIEFFIEYLDIMGVGDKYSNYTALKTIVSDVIPTELAAYTDFNEEDKIDAYLSAFGVYKRMCLDIVKVGGLTKLLVEKKRLMRDKYLSRINDELKKK